MLWRICQGWRLPAALVPREGRESWSPTVQGRRRWRALRRGRVCVVVAAEATARAFLVPHLRRLQRDFDLTVVAHTGDTEFLRPLGVEATVVPIAIERPISLRHDVLALAALTRLFRRERFDLVLSVTPKAGLLAMSAACATRTPARVHMFTGQVWATETGAKRALLKRLDRVLARCATHLLVDSPSQRAFLVAEEVVSDARSSVLCGGSICGVDVERFRPDAAARARIRASLGIPESAPVLMFLGRLNRDKGVLDLAAAFSRIAERFSEARLVVVGADEGNLRPQMIAACGAHARRMAFVDATPEPEAYFAASDVLCLPSYREGFGMVVIEGAAAEVPAVASRIYGVTDAVVEGRTGLLHSPGDAEAIVAAVTRVIEDPALRREMGAAARRRASESFSQQALTEALAQFVSALIPGR